MLQSMTGFASKTFVLELDPQNKTNVTFSLKALNSRFFESNCKLPHAISHLETKFIKLLKSKLRRGYVHLIAHVENKNVLKGKIETSLSTAGSYIEGMRAIKKEFNITQDITLDHIVQQSNIFSTTDQQIDDKTAQQLIDTLEQLADDVTKARITEGKALQKDLEQRLAVLHTEIENIEKRSKELIIEQKQKIAANLKDIDDGDAEVAQARKIALHAALDKMDIHEEIVRFKSHLKNVAAHIANKDIEKGKRLDFTMQELGRETNTIAAKCSDATISAHAINSKVEVEKMREQVQNIV